MPTLQLTACIFYNIVGSEALSAGRRARAVALGAGGKNPPSARSVSRRILTPCTPGVKGGINLGFPLPVPTPAVDHPVPSNHPGRPRPPGPAPRLSYASLTQLSSLSSTRLLRSHIKAAPAGKGGIAPAFRAGSGLPLPGGRPVRPKRQSKRRQGGAIKKKNPSPVWIMMRTGEG